MKSNLAVVRLGDICTTNQNSYSSKDDWQFVNYLDTGNITANQIDAIQYIDIKTEKLPSRSKRKVNYNNIIYSTVRPNQRHYGIIKEQPENFLVSTGFTVIEANPDKVDADFLYFLLSSDSITESLSAIAEQSTSAYPSIKPSDIENLEISLPPLSEQKQIATILKSIEDKIALNQQINKNLEEQAQAIFKACFVDFEPFGGEMPTDWRYYHLSEFLPVITGKKNANVSADKGTYPFFSCSQDIAWTDEYSFEGNAILVAGNGDFNVKFYNGKFEAYQRTYVLIPRNPIYTSWLYYAIKHSLDEITIAARGSVIKFITKGNLEDFSFAAPINLNEMHMIQKFQSINEMIAENRNENRNLASLRDALLPRLLSGEIDVSGIEVLPSALEEAVADSREQRNLHGPFDSAEEAVASMLEG